MAHWLITVKCWEFGKKKLDKPYENFFRSTPPLYRYEHHEAFFTTNNSSDCENFAFYDSRCSTRRIRKRPCLIIRCIRYESKKKKKFNFYVKLKNTRYIRSFCAPLRLMRNVDDVKWQEKYGDKTKKRMSLFFTELFSLYVNKIHSVSRSFLAYVYLREKLFHIM